MAPERVTILRFSLERRELANWAPLSAMGWTLQAVGPRTYHPTCESGGEVVPAHQVAYLLAAAPGLVSR